MKTTTQITKRKQPFPKIGFLIPILAEPIVYKETRPQHQPNQAALRWPNIRATLNFSSGTSYSLNITMLLPESPPLMKWCQLLSKLQSTRLQRIYPSRNPPALGYHNSEVRHHHLPLPWGLYSLAQWFQACFPSESCEELLTNAQVHTSIKSKSLGIVPRLWHF